MTPVRRTSFIRPLVLSFLLCLATVAAAAAALLPPPAAAAVSGAVMWTRPVPSTQYADRIYKVLPAPNGGVYAIGWKNAINYGQQRLFVARLAGSGVVLWSRTYVYSSHNNIAGEPVGAVDHAGNVVAACTMTRAGHATDMAVVKYSPTGARRWARLLDGPANGADTPKGVGIDSMNNVYVAGTCEISGGTQFAEFKLRGSDGRPIWDFDYSTEMKQDTVWDLDVTANGVSFLTGTLKFLQPRGTNVLEGALTLSVSREGQLAWVMRETAGQSRALAWWQTPTAAAAWRVTTTAMAPLETQWCLRTAPPAFAPPSASWTSRSREPRRPSSSLPMAPRSYLDRRAAWPR
jgi:hypothetical protein